jgi:hypothetical protein
LYIYACIRPDDAQIQKQILRNLRDNRPGTIVVSKDHRLLREIKILRSIVLVLSLAVGMLIANQLIENEPSILLAGVLAGLALGVAGNKLTDLINRSLKEPE